MDDRRDRLQGPDVPFLIVLLPPRWTLPFRQEKIKEKLHKLKFQGKEVVEYVSGQEQVAKGLE